MDAALKQRLIGATVLVALAVIFLPMLVDGPDAERETAGEQLSLDLPTPPDRPMETREIPLLPTPADSAATAPVASADGAEVLPVVNEVPVICGVHATDPRRRMWHWLGGGRTMSASCGGGTTTTTRRRWAPRTRD